MKAIFSPSCNLGIPPQSQQQSFEPFGRRWSRNDSKQPFSRARIPSRKLFLHVLNHERFAKRRVSEGGLGLRISASSLQEFPCRISCKKLSCNSSTMLHIWSLWQAHICLHASQLVISLEFSNAATETLSRLVPLGSGWSQP